MVARPDVGRMRLEAEVVILAYMRARVCAPFPCVVDCGAAGKCIVDWRDWDWRVLWLEEEQVVGLEAMR